jgi:hypothetical protein
MNPTKKVHISNLRVGDTVVINGEMETVGKNHLTHDAFFGYQYKGYRHQETAGYLDVALFSKYQKGEFVAYVTQL